MALLGQTRKKGGVVNKEIDDGLPFDEIDDFFFSQRLEVSLWLFCDGFELLVPLG